LPASLRTANWFWKLVSLSLSQSKSLPSFLRQADFNVFILEFLEVRMNDYSRRRFLSLLIASCIWFSTFAVPAKADGGDIPVPFYISKNGDNSDGRSWATAWNEMDQVQWNQIIPQRGDYLTIDGGTSRMVYKTPLKIQVAYTPHPFYIRVSQENGHNGQAIIQGNGQQASGVECLSGAPYLTGMKRNGLVVSGWGLDGVSVLQGLHATVEYVEMFKNKRSGLRINGGFNQIARKCIIHDNGVGVLVDPASLIMSGVVNCWIYNSSYDTVSDGIVMGNGTANPHCMVSNCVIGPGLRDGFRFLGADQFGGQLSNCLLINATRNNIATVKGLMVNKVTSFMTRANPNNMAHSCVTIKGVNQNPPNSEFIQNSIFYGGAVSVAPGITYNVTGNTQFRTTGNTMFLSPTMVDPMFTTNVANVSNQATIQALSAIDFSLQPGSPSAGTGSDITSVSQLLNTF